MPTIHTLLHRRRQCSASFLPSFLPSFVRAVRTTVNMRASTVFSLALLGAASAQIPITNPSQSSAMQEFESSLDALTSMTSVMTAFESAGNSIMSKLHATQTYIPMDVTNEADYKAQYASLERDYAEAIQNFAATQTFLTGKPKETLTKVLNMYASLANEGISTKTSGSAKETSSEAGTSTTLKSTSMETRASTADKSAGASATESSAGAAASGSGSGSGSVATVNAVGGVFAGAIAGVLAVIALL